MRNFLFLAILVAGILSMFSGCDPVRKLARSDQLADRDSAAYEYFKREKYDQAVFLFEELLGIYRPTDRAEEIFYYYAQCRYHMGELVSAAYYFEEFAKQFPRSKHVEEFRYLSAYCYYLLSDPWYLDQKYTNKALQELQLFLSRYPNTKYREECMGYMTELRERLARKAYEQAKLYYKIGYFKAAVQAFKNMMEEYPDSKYREEVQYLTVESAKKLADASIFSKKEERYRAAILEAEKFAEKYPDSEYNKSVTNFSQAAEKELEEVIEIQNEEEELALYRKFEANMKAAIDAQEPEIQSEAYEEAVDFHTELREKFPESSYLEAAEKYFRDFDKKKEKEARKQKEPENQ